MRSRRDWTDRQGGNPLRSSPSLSTCTLTTSIPRVLVPAQASRTTHTHHSWTFERQRREGGGRERERLACIELRGSDPVPGTCLHPAWECQEGNTSAFLPYHTGLPPAGAGCQFRIRIEAHIQKARYATHTLPQVSACECRLFSFGFLPSHGFPLGLCRTKHGRALTRMWGMGW